MKIKEQLKPLVPPIFWSGLKRATEIIEKRLKQPTPARDVMTMASAQSFSIQLRRLSLASDTFFIPEYAAHRPASQAILSGTFYEPATHALISELLRVRPGNIIHAGTFFGDMLPSFSRACSGAVYAFEPVLENYVMAKLCVQENKLENVVLLNAGLGSTVAVARVDTGDEGGVHRGGASQIGDRGQYTTLVTIDSFGLDDLSVIHLDVEGHELEALRGGMKTIRGNLPIIMIEDNKNNCMELLDSLNYSFSGKIPGLSIWSSNGCETDIHAILKRL